MTLGTRSRSGRDNPAPVCERSVGVAFSQRSQDVWEPASGDCPNVLGVQISCWEEEECALEKKKARDRDERLCSSLVGRLLRRHLSSANVHGACRPRFAYQLDGQPAHGARRSKRDCETFRGSMIVSSETLIGPFFNLLLSSSDVYGACNPGAYWLEAEA